MDYRHLRFQRKTHYFAGHSAPIKPSGRHGSILLQVYTNSPSTDNVSGITGLTSYTRFDRRNLYVTYDVTAALQQGNNAVGVLLGNGWYNHQPTARISTRPWRARPKFCLDLHITYSDGTKEIIATDEQWRTLAKSGNLQQHLYGRTIRCQKEQPMDTPEFDAGQWNNIYTTEPSNNIAARIASNPKCKGI